MIDMAVVATAYGVASALGASPKVMLSLFEAGLAESGFSNLNHGPDDSVGYLQQRPSQGWPNPMDVATATRSYVTKAKTNEARNPSLLPHQLAQSVQISSFRDGSNYQRQESQARALLERAGGMPAPGAPAAPGPLDLTEGVTAAAGALKTMATGIVNIGGLATQLAKLALPSNVVRAAAGGVGIILIFAGILMIGRQVKV